MASAWQDRRLRASEHLGEEMVLNEQVADLGG
jgi:hypothetical protein